MVQMVARLGQDDNGVESCGQSDSLLARSVTAVRSRAHVTRSEGPGPRADVGSLYLRADCALIVLHFKLFPAVISRWSDNAYLIL